MTIAQYEAFLSNAPKAQMLAFHGNGEPTLHPDLPLMIRLAKRSGKFNLVSLKTNGTVLQSHDFIKLKEHGLDHITLSIDRFDPDIIQTIRPMADDKKLIDIIGNIVSLYPRATALVTANKHNLHEISNIIRTTFEHGLNIVEVTLLKSLNSAQSGWTLSHEDKRLLFDQLTSISKQFPGRSLFGAPALAKQPISCKRPYLTCTVDVDGSILPCQFMPDNNPFGGISLLRQLEAQLNSLTARSEWLSRFQDRAPYACIDCPYTNQPLSTQRTDLSAVVDETGPILATEQPTPASGPDANRLQMQAIEALRGAEDASTILSKMESVLEARFEDDVLPGAIASAISNSGRIAIYVDCLATLVGNAIKSRKSSLLDNCIRILELIDRPPNNLILLSNLLRIEGRQDLSKRLLAIPSSAGARDIAISLSKAMASLAIVHDSDLDIKMRRQEYTDLLLDTSHLVRTSLPEDLARASEVVGVAKPFFLAYQGMNDRYLQAVYGDIVTRLVAAAHPGFQRTLPARGDAKIRVAFVSFYFFTHSVIKMCMSWIEKLDRSRFEIAVFHLGSNQDDMTARVREAADQFVQGPKSIPDWIGSIEAADPHIIVYLEIGMDQTTLHLAAMRLAPVQCSTWGHPQTSGLASIDYFLSSDPMEPEDGQDYYTETLIRLPHLSVSYSQLPADRGDITRASYGLDGSSYVYICCQSIFKYLPRHDDVFPEIARRVKSAKFLFIADPSKPYTHTFKSRLDAAFRRFGLEPDRFILFVKPIPYEKFPSFLRIGDLFLDSIGWSGCNTTLEAIACDLPVVTLPMGAMRGRHTDAILKIMGLQHYCARDRKQYVDLAVKLSDHSYRATAVAEIQLNKHKLFDDLSPIRALEQFFVTALDRYYDGT